MNMLKTTKATTPEQYIAETYKGKLPKADIGKSCIRYKRLSDLDLQTIRDLIKETADLPLLGAV